MFKSHQKNKYKRITISNQYGKQALHFGVLFYALSNKFIQKTKPIQPHGNETLSGGSTSGIYGNSSSTYGSLNCIDVNNSRIHAKGSCT